jgi:hypothetical protein
MMTVGLIVVSGSTERLLDTEDQCVPIDCMTGLCRSHGTTLTSALHCALRLEAFARENIYTTVFRVMTPCSLKCEYQRFGGIFA